MIFLSTNKQQVSNLANILIITMIQTFKLIQGQQLVMFGCDRLSVQDTINAFKKNSMYTKNI